MAIRKLVSSEHEVLREKASVIKTITRPIIVLLDDMVETMCYYEGLGLAAPQLGIPRRAIVVNLGEGETLKLINPEILESDGEVVEVEGCLSLPGVLGEVPRAENIVVEALNENNNTFKMNATGLLARIIQHEIDHLQGVLFVDRARRMLDPEEIEAKGENI